MKKIFVAMLMVLLGLSPSFGGGFYRNVSVRLAKTIIAEHEGKGDLIILDVRTPGEFSKGHLKGSINIDFWGKEFIDSVSTLDKTKIYLVYCTSGVRSRGALKKMRKIGFERIYNMRTGMLGWKAARFPVVSEDDGDG